MQRLRQSLLSLARFGHEAATAARVGPSPQQAAASLAAQRHNSTAIIQELKKLDSSDPNYLQQLKRVLRPEVSGRKQFQRKWQKQLQIKWNAQERKANEAAARQARDEERRERWAKRSEFKKAVAAAAAAEASS